MADEKTPTPKRTSPFQVGDMVALALRDGRCPVGGIAAMDDTWIAIRLKSFMDGTTTEKIVAIRWNEIERAELAYVEDAIDGMLGPGELQDAHLGELQTAWHRHHFGLEGKDPVEKIRREIMAEEYRERRSRG